MKRLTNVTFGLINVFRFSIVQQRFLFSNFKLYLVNLRKRFQVFFFEGNFEFNKILFENEMGFSIHLQNK